MSRTSFGLGALSLFVALFFFVTIGYADEGLATWYGPGFQGNRMANGQIYDMYDPTTTAANWWPFGTWIKVTNPANGKSVTVQVRDRGGFTHALDLSYAAFAILDDPKKMQIKVTYQVVPGPDSPAPANQGKAAQPQPAPNPPPPPKPAPAPVPKDPGPPPSEYTVQPGDTLASIAAKYEIDAKLIISLNGIDDPNHIVSGQRLKLRDSSRPAETYRGTTAPDAPRASSASGEYIIQPGDTLVSIANQLGMDTDTLAGLNGIEDRNLIRVGQHLHTSADTAGATTKSAQSPSGAAYTVAPGDTLSNIAYNYGVSEDAIAKANGITDPNSIVIGQELQIPGANTPSSASAPSAAKKQYVVKDGETLSDVAAAFNVDLASLISVNEIADPDLVQPGQVLTIP